MTFFYSSFMVHILSSYVFLFYVLVGEWQEICYLESFMVFSKTLTQLLPKA